MYLDRRIDWLRNNVRYGEVEPHPSAIAQCREVFRLLRDSDADPALRLPHVTTTGGGELICEWYGDGRDLIGDFMPDGTTGFAKVYNETDADDSEAKAAPEAEDWAEAFRWLSGKEI